MNNTEFVAYEVAEALSNYQELPKLASETWSRDSEDPDLWHGPHGVIVNTAALAARKIYYEIITQED